MFSSEEYKYKKKDEEISNRSPISISIIVLKSPPGCLRQTFKVCHFPLCDTGKLWVAKTISNAPNSANTYGDSIKWLQKIRLQIFEFVFL